MEASQQPAGMHLVARLLDPSVRGTRVAKQAMAAGIAISTVEASRLTPGEDRDLILGYTYQTRLRTASGLWRMSYAVLMDSIEGCARSLRAA